MIVFDDEPKGPLWQYLHREINLPWSEDIIVLGLQRQDLSIAGAVAYNCWLEDSVFMHVRFGPHSFTKSFIREAFRYPFETCDKSRVYGLTPITSTRALRFSERIGFRKLLDTDDFRIQVMTREECRWLHDSKCSNWLTPQHEHSAGAAKSG